MTMDQGPDWERELLRDLLQEGLREKRRARRWGIFFKLLGFAYFSALLGLLLWQQTGGGNLATLKDHTGLVDVKGLISAATPARANRIVEGLRKAYADDHTKGILLRINSPGGSPVQAAMVYDEIRRLRKLHPKIPVYAAITDVGASGAYYIAAAADRIYVNPSSLVGSIGVLVNGFGFVQAMDKLGVERRLLTAGERKGILDPFSPLKPEDKAYVETLLGRLHRQFIAAVKAGRGDRLAKDPRLFSGLFWSGEEAVKLGLADGFGSPGYVAREVIGAEDIVDYTPREDWFKRLSTGLGAGLGTSIGRWLGLTENAPLR